MKGLARDLLDILIGLGASVLLLTMVGLLTGYTLAIIKMTCAAVMGIL